MRSPVKQRAVRNTYFRFWTAHIFFSVKNVITKCSYKTFRFQQSSISWRKIFRSKKTFQQNALQAQPLITGEHSALSDVSNAKLVLLGAELRTGRWISAGCSLAASSCCRGGKISNMLAEPGQLLRWPKPGKKFLSGKHCKSGRGLFPGLAGAWSLGPRRGHAPTAGDGRWGRPEGGEERPCCEAHSLTGGWIRVAPCLWCSINLSACLGNVNIFWTCDFCWIIVCST